ncbi:MAG: glutamate-5-semialdehyde dehydrogenase [Polyangiaceae bacterium]
MHPDANLAAWSKAYHDALSFRYDGRVMDTSAYVATAAKRAKAASRLIGTETSARKDDALRRLAKALVEQRSDVLAANGVDVAEARKAGLAEAMVDRLLLDDKRYAAMVGSVTDVLGLTDPSFETVTKVERPSGIRVTRMRVPLGLIGLVYEARPNATVEASALTIKTGNAIILRGGSEAFRTNQALANVIRGALRDAGLPEDAVLLLETTDRDAVRALIQQDAYVDLLIPRGGESLIRFVTENARVPVVQHYKGVCHLYADSGVDPELVANVVMNAKMQRPSACNALECLLVDASAAPSVLPVVTKKLLAAGCELRGCPETRAIAPEVRPATDQDWGMEFLDRVLAIRVVRGLEGALAHISEYGSGHTEAILTKNDEHAARFRREVDAACIMVNASTRFHDGGELGLGAELGIATSRLHWRGPMGLESLTTIKWVVDGEGQVRA